MSFTRRTHIVRVSATKGKEPPATDTYADIEVLDAISFNDENGKEQVLNMKTANVVPFIQDDTGDGNGKGGNNCTRRSHMKRLTGEKDKPDAPVYFDVEVLDAMAYRDANGNEWVFKMDEKSPVYDTTDNSGTASATRRVHQERIGTKGPMEAKEQHVIVERSDTISFRYQNGKERILKMPSFDDGKGKRANTFVSDPKDYDPSDTSPDAVIPPENKDPNVYCAFISKKITKPSKGKLVFDNAPYILCNRLPPDGPPEQILDIFMPDNMTIPDDPLWAFNSIRAATGNYHVLRWGRSLGQSGGLTEQRALDVFVELDLGGLGFLGPLGGLVALFGEVPGFQPVGTSAAGDAADAALGYQWHFEPAAPTTQVIVADPFVGEKNADGESNKIKQGPLWWIRKLHYGTDHS